MKLRLYWIWISSNPQFKTEEDAEWGFHDWLIDQKEGLIDSEVTETHVDSQLGFVWGNPMKTQAQHQWFIQHISHRKITTTEYISTSTDT